MPRMASMVLALAMVLMFTVSITAQGGQDGGALIADLLDPKKAIPVPIHLLSEGCRGVNGTSSLPANLQTCQFQNRIAEEQVAWYSFSIAPDAVRNITVLLNLRVFQGEAEMYLFGPGGRAPMEANFLYSTDAAQEMYISLIAGNIAPGEYRLVILSTHNDPVVRLTVWTTGLTVQLAAEERQALRELAEECCPRNPTPGGPASICDQILPALLDPKTEMEDSALDLCHAPPNACNEEGKLTRLVLAGAGLQCKAFPRSLAGFTELRILDLSHNNLTDTLSSVGQVVSSMPYLTRLYLVRTELKGEMDCSLIQDFAPNLATLALSSNFLVGNLPSCYTITDTLEELYISRNDLTGTLPEFNSRSRLSILLAAAQTTGEGFVGEIPKSVSEAQGLQYLNLANNGLKGPLPTLPPNMIDIDLSENYLEGQLWSKVPVSVARIDLHDNNLGGTLPNNMATDWPNVTHIYLADNNLRGDLPVLPASLQFISVANNKLGPHIKGAPGGRATTTGRRLRQEGKGLVQLPENLVYVNINNNSFAFDVNTVDWTPLWYLFAGRNQLTGKLPASFMSGTGLEAINLSHNQLTGRIDQVAWSAEYLNFIDLSDNQLEGDLPASLAKLESLAYLDLSNNRLSGQLNLFADALLPDNFLTNFNVSGNQFTGTVPASLGKLGTFKPRIGSFTMSGRRIPRTMDVSFNRLTGPYPTFIVKDAPQAAAACRCTMIIRTGGGDNRLTCPTAQAVQQGGWSLEVARRFNDTCMDPSTNKRVLFAYTLDPKQEYVVRQEDGRMAASSITGTLDTADGPVTRARGASLGVLIGAVVGACVGAMLLAGLIFLGYKKFYQPYRAKQFQRYEDQAPFGPSLSAPADAQVIGMAALPPLPVVSGAQNGRETV